MKALVFNPGSNSLKFEVAELEPGQRSASQSCKLISASIDDIGKQPTLTVFEGRKQAHSEDADAPDMQAAVKLALAWTAKQHGLDALDFTAVRVVHGGTRYAGPARVTPQVLKDIADLEELAPLHNESSLKILAALEQELPGLQRLVTFDTAFHRTLPEIAWRYPIERETADRHGVRKFGFHGLSHRYMLEHYALVMDKRPEECTLVTAHLESGCSAAAICRGQSVDTTMGLTPLEGLMMGSRSGSIDPAILPYLMHHENKTADEILTLLNKKSGMIGIAGGSLDTRVLEKRNDESARLALTMFSYRVKLAVGAYLAALGDAEAVLLGGGIGEDSPWLRAAVCAGLKGWGVDLEEEANRSTSGDVRITRDGSRLHVWGLPVEEGLQMAFECAQLLAR
jgi:acetate kinase